MVNISFIFNETENYRHILNSWEIWKLGKEQGAKQFLFKVILFQMFEVVDMFLWQC